MRFRKRPVVVDAIRYTGDNADELVEFGNRSVIKPPYREHPYVATLEGAMTISPGDWLIRGVQGEYYPCKPDIFEATYEEVS